MTDDDSDVMTVKKAANNSNQISYVGQDVNLHE